MHNESNEEMLRLGDADVLQTPQLSEALAELDRTRNDALAGGVEPGVIDNLVDSVRRVSVELVEAVLLMKERETRTDSPESHRIEIDAYERIQKILAAPLPSDSGQKSASLW